MSYILPGGKYGSVGTNRDVETLSFELKGID